MFEKVKILLVVTIMVLSFWAVFIKTQTTLVGYEMGRLQEKERELLSKKSRLQTELAKTTDKQNLFKAALRDKGSQKEN